VVRVTLKGNIVKILALEYLQERRKTIVTTQSSRSGTDWRRQKRGDGSNSFSFKRPRTRDGIGQDWGHRDNGQEDGDRATLRAGTRKSGRSGSRWTKLLGKRDKGRRKVITQGKELNQTAAETPQSKTLLKTEGKGIDIPNHQA